MKKKIGYILNSTYLKSITVLFTGTALAQLITFCSSPLFSRLYTPEDYGKLALFTSTIGIISIFITFRYELAITISENDEDAKYLFWINIILIVFFSIIIQIIVLLIQIISFYTNSSIDKYKWINYVPITVFLVAIGNVLMAYNNRLKKYEDMSRATITKTVCVVLFNLVGYFIFKDWRGLVTSTLFSVTFGNIKLLKNIIDDGLKLSYFNITLIKENLLRYIDYPKYQLVGSLCNAVSVHLTTYFMGGIFSERQLGQYSFANRMINMPITLIGKAIGDVFIRQAVEEKKITGNIINSFKKTSILLIILGVIGSLFLFLFSDIIFILLFGEKWLLASKYIKYLIPLMFARFVVTPIINVTCIQNKQVIASILYSLLLIANIIPGILAIRFQLSDFNYLFLISLFTALIYLVFYLYSMKITKNGGNRK